jgi:hypothetical protein
MHDESYRKLSKDYQKRFCPTQIDQPYKNNTAQGRLIKHHSAQNCGGWRLDPRSLSLGSR